MTACQLFFQIALKMSNLLNSVSLCFSISIFFFGGMFFSCKWFVGDVIKAVSIHFLFNWGDLKSMCISSWGCSDVLFEGVTQWYAFCLDFFWNRPFWSFPKALHEDLKNFQETEEVSGYQKLIGKIWQPANLQKRTQHYMFVGSISLMGNHQLYMKPQILTGFQQ